MASNNIVVLNASNLQGGGAVQVAVSLVSELSHLKIKKDIVLVLSSVVYRECNSVGVDFNGFRALHRIDHFGFRLFNKQLRRIFHGSDVVFTVFGPLYLWWRPQKSVVGFAQPWILYPKSDAYLALPRAKRVVNNLKYAIQRQFFRTNSHVLIVEAEHARIRLVTLFTGLPVFVVSNALNSVFVGAISAEERKAPARAAGAPHNGVRHLTLGHVGRAYSHKNLSILPAVRQALWERHGVKATIRTTLNEAEWAAQSEEFRSSIENVGALSLQECIPFYQGLDGVIFPSLLESFSAAPLEAMAMRLPLFASDRAFVRDFCDDIPFYFDPLDPVDIAEAIVRCFDLPPEDLAARLDQSVNHVLSQPTAKDRAKRIAELLTSVTHERIGAKNVDDRRRNP